MTDRPAFRCPPSMRPHVEEVFAGCYDAPGVEFETPPRVLDIGMCCGDFAIWAMHRWPGAKVECYEPNPEAEAIARSNLLAYEPTLRQWVIHPVAVFDSAGKRLLFFGRSNIGEASLYRGDEQSELCTEVECIAADTLGEFDVVKVDAEASEWPILRLYLRRHMPRVVAFEFHSHQDRENLEDLLREDYFLVSGRIDSKDRGVLVYARGSISR